MKPFKFMHIADTHLGLEQYQSQERFKDFNRAFKNVLQVALDHEVDFVLIAGDVFEKSNVAPATLTSIHSIITAFKGACKERFHKDVPIIAIQGNHDAGYNYGVKRSWMDFLAELGLIILLDKEENQENDKIVFTATTPAGKKGGYITIGDAMIYGVRYLGINTAKYLVPIRDAIKADESKITILMMHMGVKNLGVKDDEEDDADELMVTLDDPALESLHDKVDYLALGHYHKQGMRPASDPWIFNPGSTEVTSGKEYFKEFDRGAIIVEYLDKHTKNVQTVNFTNGKPMVPGMLPNRRFTTVSIQLDSDHNATFEQTLEFVVNHPALRDLKKADPPAVIDGSDLDVPVLFLFIDGRVPYSMIQFNSRKIKEELEKQLTVIVVRVNSRVRSKLDDVTVDYNEGKTILQIEKETFEGLVATHDVYKAHKEVVAALMSMLKQQLNTSSSSIDEMEQSIKEFWVTTLKPEGGTIFDARFEPATGPSPASHVARQTSTTQEEVTFTDKKAGGTKQEQFIDELDGEDYDDGLDG